MSKVTMTELRDTLYLLIYNNITQNVHLDELPKATKKIDKMVMLDFSSTINDLKAFQNGIVRVWLCVKDSDFGKSLGEMENDFDTMLANYRASNKGKRIELDRRSTFVDTLPSNSLRCMIIELRVKLKENNI